ncbi:MAG: amidohydrolase [Alphaproteobacteria bacterium]|nr:amidohydrolase [Alphaproteobacteria bacterium]
MVLAGCATAEAPEAAKPAAPSLDPQVDSNPFPSTYKPFAGEPTAFVGATAFTGNGKRIDNATLLVKDGKIESIAAGVAAPAGYKVVDVRGRFITPGIIDAHSHLGVYPQPGVRAHSDGNESVSPNTAQVWAEHSVWPQDEGFNAVRRGGVTAMLVLPGSANLFGGRSVTLKNVPSITMQGMKFPGAPYGLKMACGENPKRVYGTKGSPPSTRMGNVAGYRAAWIEAAQYARKWDGWRASGGKGEMPGRDLKLDTLAGVLKGEILVQNHCYRADEMAVMIDIAKEFGYKIRAFHHASEAYKIADLLAKNDICAATWAGWWGFKMESLDGIPANAALLHAAGGCAVIHSDDPILAQRLNQEAAAALAAGRKLGLRISDEDAIGWITSNPAKMLGILDKTGTLEPGKMADVVVWSANPLSVYAKADSVYVDGALLYDRANPGLQPRSDFMIDRKAGGTE